MKIEQVAIQLYTLRNHCKTAADLAATARKVREIGYQAVQLSGVGPIPEDEITTILADAGLTLCATHEPALKILDETEAVIARLRRLGCTRTAYPHPAGVDLSDRGAIDTLARKLDAAGAKLRQAGITLAYHNHGVEFAKVPGTGQTILDYLCDHTAPEHLSAEPDTYWIHYGGGDNVAWMRRLRGRLGFMHLKDYAYNLAENRPVFCEIGAGTLPFVAIIAEAEKSGCEWFIVEQDTTPGCPFDSIRRSFDHIRANLIG